MKNQQPNGSEQRPEQRNVSMSEQDKQKTVANPSPGSSDPGAESGGNHTEQKTRAASNKS